MTKNKIGGKGHKRSKRTPVSTVQAPFSDDETEYAYVLDTLGSGWMKVFCFKDKCEKLAKVRGSMYKKVWIGKDDVVLVSLRDYEQKKCDIIYRYTPDETRCLVRMGQIESNYSTMARGTHSTHQGDTFITFEDEEPIIDDI